MADRDLDAVVALFDAVAGFVDRLPSADVAAFLAHLSAQELPGDTGAARAPEAETVRLLTAHASKGLEWDLVCVAGVQEGVWPDLRERTSLLGIEELVERASGVDGTAVDRRTLALAEERRLFYVACTRARRRLVVSAVEGALDGADAGANASRFLDLVVPPPEDGRPLTELPRSLTLLGAGGRAAPCPDRPADPGRAPHGRRLGAPAAGRRGRPRCASLRVVGAGPLSDDAPLVPEEPRPRAALGDRDVPELPAELGARCGRCRGVGRHHPDRGHRGARGGPAGGGRAAAWRRAGRPRRRARPARPRPRLGRPAPAGSAAGDARPVPALACRQPARGPRRRGGLRRRRRPGADPRPGRPARRDGDGRLVVVDLKTGKTASRNTEEHGQLAAYQVAVSAGAFADHGTVPGGAAAAGRHRGEGQGAAPGAAARRVPLDATWAGELVAQVGEGMGAATFEVRTGSHCSRCPMRRAAARCTSAAGR